MRYQPQGALRASPRAKGGIAFVFGANPLDAFGSGSALTDFASPTRAAYTHGLAKKYVSASSQYTFIAPPDNSVDLTKPYSFVIAFVLDSSAVTTRVVSFKSQTSVTNVQLTFTGTGQRLGYLHGNSTGEVPKVLANEALVVGMPYVVCAGWDGTEYFMYINGVKQNGGIGASIVTSATTTGIYLGRRNSGGSHLDGQIAMFAYLPGTVDAASLSTNPYQLFAAPEEDYEAAAAGGHDVMGAASVQANTAGTGAVTQDHNVTGTASAQGNTGATGAVGQEHQLAGSASTQSNIGGTGALTAPDTLNGLPGAQENIGGSGAIGQTHVLGGSDSVQANTGGTGAISIVSDPRYARPSGTVAAGAWLPSTGTSLHAVVDEPSADAADYMHANTPGTAELALNPVTDPQTSSGQVVRYQAWSPAGGGLTVSLKQGAAVVASRTHATLPLEPTVFALVLSAAECDSITNYADLRFVFEAF